ncbi:MAG: hypothetical protein R3E63_10275 [Pseudomonadales bacterium]
MKRIAAVLSIFFAASVSTTYADIAVIANRNMPISTVTVEQAAAIFLSQLDVLADGTQLIPVDQENEQVAREEFYSKVIKKTPSEMNAYWSRLVFSGEGQPPKKISGDAEVIALVKANPNIVGYVDAATVDDTVKVLLTIH